MEMATHVNCDHAMEQRKVAEPSMSDGCEMLEIILNAVWSRCFGASSILQFVSVGVFHVLQEI